MEPQPDLTIMGRPVVFSDETPPEEIERLKAAQVPWPTCPDCGQTMKVVGGVYTSFAGRLHVECGCGATLEGGTHRNVTYVGNNYFMAAYEEVTIRIRVRNPDEATRRRIFEACGCINEMGFRGSARGCVMLQGAAMTVPDIISYTFAIAKRDWNAMFGNIQYNGRPFYGYADFHALPWGPEIEP